MAISVIVIEDDLHYNQALKKVIDYDKDLECVAQCYRGRDAVEKLSALNADIAIVDIKLPDFTGIEIIQAMRNLQINTQFIMCTSFEDDEHVFEALKAGAVGYLLKGESMDTIITSIKEALTGGAPMSAAIARKVVGHFCSTPNTASSPAGLLTHTETEILQLLSSGLLYKEIAQKKFVSIDTVKKHIGNIYRKLQVNNKVEAINKVFKR